MSHPVSWCWLVDAVMAATPPAVADAATDASTRQAVQVNSIWDFVVKGGPIMIPLGICSLLALAIVAERLLVLRRSNIVPPAFLPGLKKVLDKHGGDVKRGIDYCEKSGTPIARICAVGLRHAGEPRAEMERHVTDAGQWEILGLRKYVRGLAVITSIAPLMGLLGTIFGMIQAFQTVAVSGEALGKTEMLAGGIYEAMITTAAGLLVAIPCMIAYHWVTGRIERLVAEMDRACIDFVEHLTRPSPTSTATPPPAHPGAASNGVAHEPTEASAATA